MLDVSSCAALALLAISCASHPSSPPTTTDGSANSETISERVVVPVDKFAEGEFTLAVGSRIDVQFTASAALEWNLHTHNDGDTQLLLVGNDASGQYSHTANAAGDYWPMWTNRTGIPVSLDVEITLSAGATWNGWLAPAR